MVSIELTIGLAIIGIIATAFIVSVITGGTKEEMCRTCKYRPKVKSSGQGKQCAKAKVVVEPPPKHNWEITHADKPARNLYRKNGRRNKI